VTYESQTHNQIFCHFFKEQTSRTTMKVVATFTLILASSATAFVHPSAPFLSKTVLYAEVTPAIIKQLRESTGAGMMDCKKALLETDGDMEAAAEFLRKKGLAKADKKASRVAAEGKIVYASKGDKAVVVEVNCETDFVAKDASFLEFADSVAKCALEVDGDDINELLAVDMGGSTVEEARQALVAKIGENIQVRRFAGRGGDDHTIGGYVHMNRIGVLVELEGGSEGLAGDVAMHVAAMNPPFAVPDEVPSAVLDKERKILSEQALESGKPADIVEKMVEGRIRKYLEEICLVSQTFVKTNDKTVGKLLEENGAKMVGFSRIAVGEGIEKKSDNFAEEVAKMAAGK
jgi:elongation factor Ts